MMLRITSPTASDSSSEYSFPSLPSLQSLAPAATHPSAAPSSASSYLCVASIKPLRASFSAPALAVSSDSSLLYSASESEVTVLDLASGRPIEAFAAAPSAGSVKSAVVSPDGQLFTAHQEGRIRVWRRSSRHRLQ